MHGCVLAVEAMLDDSIVIDDIENEIGVVLESGGEHHYLIVLAEVLEELFCERTHQKLASISQLFIGNNYNFLIVNECFIEVQNEAVHSITFR